MHQEEDEEGEEEEEDEEDSDTGEESDEAMDEESARNQRCAFPVPTLDGVTHKMKPWSSAEALQPRE